MIIKQSGLNLFFTAGTGLDSELEYSEMICKYKKKLRHALDSWIDELAFDILWHSLEQ